MFNENSGYINTKQAAKLTGYTKDYVGQLARKGHLDSKKIGRERLVKTEDLFKYVLEISDATSNAEVDQVIQPKVQSQPEDEQTRGVQTIIAGQKASLAQVTNSEDHKDVSESAARPVVKKIISPWVTQQSDSVISPLLMASDNSVEFSKKAYGKITLKEANKEQPLLSNNLLPMISTSAVMVAMLLFTFSVTSMASSYVNNDRNTSLSASVGSLDIVDQVALGWYQTVNQLLP